MITDFLLSGLFGALNLLLGLLPNWSLPDFTGIEQDISGYMNEANRVFPVDTFIYVILGAIALKLLMVALDLVVWIYHQFWGSD